MDSVASSHLARNPVKMSQDSALGEVNAHLRSSCRQSVAGYTTEVCGDAWPVRRLTYRYLPSGRISPPFDLPLPNYTAW